MPASAWAALASTRSEMRLMPATSVTEYIMQMSEGPTYGFTSPEATVETMTLGTPIGRPRMARVASAVPPEPPAEMRPPRSRRPRHELLEGHRHLADRGATVAGEDRALALRVMPRDLSRMDHRGRRLAGGRQIHGDRAQAELVQAVPQEEQLAALGVEGARDVGGPSDGGGHRELDDPPGRATVGQGRGRPVERRHRRRPDPRGRRSGGRAGRSAGPRRSTG